MAVLRRIKERIKKVAQTKRSSRKIVKAVSKKRVKIKEVPSRAPEIKKDVLGAQEMAVEQTKYSHAQMLRYRRPMAEELPPKYEKDRIVLQVRDPWWLHVYWEVAENTWSRLKEKLREIFFMAKKVLRVYDVSHIIFNGHNAHRYYDIDVHPESNNWYIDIAGPGRSWCVDYGLKLPNGEFITILRSNVVTTPLDGPSWITDEEWMVPEEMFARLYGMGFGLGQSSPVGKAWQERIKRALFSGILASPGITSAASPVKKLPKERKFWLIVDCELIVYGATEPDAQVTVQGKPIKLRQDGTFTLRYALPDGRQVIPVRAISADKIEERTITPIVSRETKSSILVKEEAVA